MLRPELMLIALNVLAFEPSFSFQPSNLSHFSSGACNWPTINGHRKLTGTGSNQILSNIALFSAHENDEELPPSTPSEERGERAYNVGDTSSLIRAYRIGSVLLFSVAIALFSIPDKTNTAKLATKLGGAAGFGLAASVSHILASATVDNRLANNRYKRLNIGLFGFSGVGLFSIPGEAAFHPKVELATTLASAMFLVRVFSCTVSWIGWKRGVLLGLDSDTHKNGMQGTKIFKTELWNGIQSTFKGTFTREKRGKGYRNLLFLVILWGFSSFMQGLLLQDLGKSMFDISLEWSAISRLFLISTMIYTLKDGAATRRLTSTTCIYLNLLIGIWLLLVGVGTGITLNGFNAKKASDVALFTLPFFWSAFNNSQIKKKERKQELSSPTIDGDSSSS